MNSVYKINKGINKPIEFKGLKAQYIGYLGARCQSCYSLSSAILYISGVNMFVCLGIIAPRSEHCSSWGSTSSAIPMDSTGCSNDSPGETSPHSLNGNTPDSFLSSTKKIVNAMSQSPFHC
jgi:hypothetical protein